MPHEQFTYDGVGNRLTMVGQSSPPSQTTVYTYDFEGRLIELDSPGLIAQYKYNSFGRRIEKNVNGVVSRYVYDGPNIAAEYDGDWNLVTKYLPSLGIDDPLAMEQGTGSYFYHKDGLGTVTDLTNASGNAVRNYRYRSFGEIYSETGSLVQPFTFTGREYDPESGLYYYRARYYDPRTGRFIGKDPIGFAGGDVNLYRMVENNPINFIDPDGLIILPAMSRESYGKDFPAWVPEWFIDISYEMYVDPTIGVGPPAGASVKVAGIAGRKACEIGVKSSLKLSAHAIERMEAQQISKKMVETALRIGERYWDPVNETAQYYLRQGFASGKSLLVSQNPVTGLITTVQSGYRILRLRFLPW